MRQETANCAMRSLILFTKNIFLDDKIEKDEVGKSCRTRWRAWGELTTRRYWCAWEENIKMDLKKIVMDGFIWLTIRTGDYILWARLWTFGIYWRARNFLLKTSETFKKYEKNIKYRNRQLYVGPIYRLSGAISHFVRCKILQDKSESDCLIVNIYKSGDNFETSEVISIFTDIVSVRKFNPRNFLRNYFWRHLGNFDKIHMGTRCSCGKSSTSYTKGL